MKTEIKNNLKPCPFCGGEAKIVKDTDVPDIEHYIQCTGCGLVFNGSWGTYCADDLEDDIKKWNTRAKVNG